VRLTTRYGTEEFTQSLFGIIHECGHGLYEQGLPTEAVGTPLCSAVSLGIHESQSRLWENMVGRSREFWEHYLPLLKESFPEQLADMDLETFYAAANHVEPSTIRVEADEVTYNLHILLRTELEIGMVEGDIETADLPGAWNQRMEQYLGICPPTDAEGVLQDVHWSFGGIGYFPTYALGNLYAAQLFDAAAQQIPGLMADISHGSFERLLSWLRQNVHGRGARLPAAGLIEAVSGQELQSRFLMEYLETKFGQLYALDID
jgi:carboxypeptidase Taq